MGGRGLVAAGDIDRELAAVFLANGEGFLRGSDAADRGDAREICYVIAIATELVLKAFLVARGWSDDRCRRHVRHDLEKALAFAKAAGLKAVAGLDGIVTVLNAYYPTHTFDRFVVPAGDAAFPARARAIVGDLFERVRPQVEASGGR
ncbi:hypothetical protein [Mesorhizobium amorphae]|uniref:hypothetical protein n=1 Tax=Mesorhizobium amorphae TaxID=71433 RepID=UPI001185EE99|nr:hypothetical protein [Mesorhizobium amorphae]